MLAFACIRHLAFEPGFPAEIKGPTSSEWLRSASMPVIATTAGRIGDDCAYVVT